MNLVEAYKLAIREIDKLRRHAEYNAKHMSDSGRKEAFLIEAQNYANAKRLLQEEIKKSGEH